MTVLVEFGISNERFAFGEHISQHAALSAELERVVPTGDNAVPYVRVTGSPDLLTELGDTLESSETVGSVSSGTNGWRKRWSDTDYCNELPVIADPCVR